MQPSNNYSPIPWYESIAEQNARKWWINGKVYPLFAQGAFLLPFQIILPHDDGRSLGDASIILYTPDGEWVPGAAISETEGLRLYQFADYDVYVWNGTTQVKSGGLENGRYYMIFNDDINVRYSEIFTVVNNIEPYLRISWYDQSDLVMDAGRIIYQGGYINTIYLQADLAKPQYLFNEEGEERDGYFYPTKQVSEKRFNFKFWASEYLLDCMRFIRMSDFVTIAYRGKTYQADTFLLTPEWEDAGDVAAVTAEFDTATVAKKVGVGYIRGLRGDFNDDYNADFNNQTEGE